MGRNMTKLKKTIKAASGLYLNGNVLTRQELKKELEKVGSIETLNEIELQSGERLVLCLGSTYKINSDNAALAISWCLDKLAIKELILPSNEEWEAEISKVERTEEELIDKLLEILAAKNKTFIPIIKSECEVLDPDDDKAVFDTWFSETDEYLKIIKRYVIDYIPDGYDQNL